MAALLMSDIWGRIAGELVVLWAVDGRREYCGISIITPSHQSAPNDAFFRLRSAF
jgi:hypothetical protein